jgi:hypothetical protein
MTTTPAGVTTKAALEMKFWLAVEPSADRPSTYHAEGETWTVLITGASCASAAGSGHSASQRISATPWINRKSASRAFIIIPDLNGPPRKPKLATAVAHQPMGETAPS